MRNVLIGLAGGLLVSMVMVPGCLAGDLTPGQTAGGFAFLGGFGALFGLALAGAEWLGENEGRAQMAMFGVTKRRRIANAWAALSDVLPRLSNRRIGLEGRTWIVTGMRGDGSAAVFRVLESDDPRDLDGLRFVDPDDPRRDFAVEAGLERHHEDGVADARSDRIARMEAAGEED